MATKLKTVEDELHARDEEAWRPALIAFYRADCWHQSAENVERGQPLTMQDKRLIEVLQAALALAPFGMRRAA